MSAISRKNQITLPVDALREAGLQPGDDVRVRAVGLGRLEIMREQDIVDRFAGIFTGVYPPGYLKDLRREWE